MGGKAGVSISFIGKWEGKKIRKENERRKGNKRRKWEGKGIREGNEKGKGNKRGKWKGKGKTKWLLTF